MLGFTPLAATPLADDSSKINYELSVNEITTNPPVVDNANAFITVPCAANDIATTPVVDAISISNIYNFDATEVTTGLVLVDIVTMFEDETIIPADTISSNPAIDQIDVSITSNFTADSITATPVVDSILTSITSSLAATDITISAPTIDSLTLGFVYNLDASELSVGSPSVDDIAISVITNFAPIDITATPIVDSLPIQQLYDLAANEITAGIPTLPARFLWDFQEETSETWANISDINAVWLEQDEIQETWSSAA